MTRVLGVGSAFAVSLAVSLSAQTPRIVSDDDYMTVMKEVGPLSQQFRKNIEGNGAASASRDAARLSVLFTDVQAYWEAKGAQDAIDFAKTAVMASADSVKALAAKDLLAAANAQKAMQGTCMACHMTHRERLPDGTSRIK